MDIYIHRVMLSYFFGYLFLIFLFWYPKMLLNYQLSQVTSDVFVYLDGNKKKRHFIYRSAHKIIKDDGKDVFILYGTCTNNSE